VKARKAIAPLLVALAGIGALALPAGAAAEGPCPNEAIREEQHSTFLPECRAFEMVSPPEKNGLGVQGSNFPAIASTDGSGVAYLSRGSFGDTVGAGVGGGSIYLARRGPTAWSNHGILPTPKFDTPVEAGGAEVLKGFSDDLDRVVLATLDLPGTGATPETVNLYSEETADRSLQLLTSPTQEATKNPLFRFATAISFNGIPSLGASADSRHLAFKSFVQLTTDGLPPIARRIYQWDEGTLRLASILPDGTPVVGAELGAEESGYRQSVSPDGTRVLFTYEGQLYMRVEHTSTALVSESENPAFTEPAQEVVLQQMTGDSRHVLFTTSSPLVAEDENSGPDLYLYTDGPDPESEPHNLTLLTKTGDLDRFGPAEVIGSSDDAATVYYYNHTVIFRVAGGTVSRVAENVGIPQYLHLSENNQFGATQSGSGGARVTPDSRYLAFYAEGAVERAGVPVAEYKPSDYSHEIYLYDALTDKLRCVSCPAEGPPTENATIEPNVVHTQPESSFGGVRPKFLANDGSVFFTTPAPLVPRDTNGVTDAYRYDAASGKVSLLSTGTAPGGSGFVDANPSGHDAFIVTAQPLVGWDTDSYIDIYDVRSGGGYPEPPPPPAACSGESCRPPAASPPPPAGLSSSQPGAGNRHASHRRCPRGKRAVKHKGRVRCVKKPKPRHHHRRVHGREGGAR
jgi:hypothetical protein